MFKYQVEVRLLHLEQIENQFRPKVTVTSGQIVQIIKIKEHAHACIKKTNEPNKKHIIRPTEHYDPYGTHSCYSPDVSDSLFK